MQMRLGRLLVIVCALGGALSCGVATGRGSVVEPAGDERVEPRPSRVEPGRAVLWVGGDVMLSPSLRRSAGAGGDPAAGLAAMLAPLREVWRRDAEDAFVLVNLETPTAKERRATRIAVAGRTADGRRVAAPINAPQWLVRGLSRAGIDGVTLANNHSLDQRRAGLHETLLAAWSAGLVTTGAGHSTDVSEPLVHGPRDAELAVLSFLDREHPEPELRPEQAGVNVFGPDALDQVRRASERFDAVVVLMHVVAELRSRPRPSWRASMEALADAGADVVALHGQHVPGPVETWTAGDGRAVVFAFGLGNLLTDMGALARPGRRVREDADKWELPATREALMMRVELRGGVVETSFLPIFVHNERALAFEGLVRGPPGYAVVPLASCGEPLTLDARWPEALRQRTLAWVELRRSHLMGLSGLEVRGCEPGTIALLPPPPIHGTL